MQPAKLTPTDWGQILTVIVALTLMGSWAKPIHVTGGEHTRVQIALACLKSTPAPQHYKTATAREFVHHLTSHLLNTLTQFCDRQKHAQMTLQLQWISCQTQHSWGGLISLPYLSQQFFLLIAKQR